MATAKQAKQPKIKKSAFWAHMYSVTKVDMSLNAVETITVTGSTAAIAKQIEFEDKGFFAVVLNVTRNDEEYRTPGAEDFKSASDAN